MFRLDCEHVPFFVPASIVPKSSARPIRCLQIRSSPRFQLPYLSKYAYFCGVKYCGCLKIMYVVRRYPIVFHGHLGKFRGW
jgi:hypothetical protein